MKEGDKGREREDHRRKRKRVELMELLLGIFFALS